MTAMAAFIRRRARARHADSDKGFTLIELLVSMSIFAVLLAVMMSVVVAMNSSVSKTTGVADAAAQGLRAVQALDKEVRYGDWINAISPTPATSGDWYVSFEGVADNTATGAGMTECYQWRLDTAGNLQQRLWNPASTPTATVTATSPAFTTVAVRVVYSATTSPFALQFSTAGGGTAGSQPFRQLVVDLVLTSKARPIGHAENKVVITARNSNYPPGSPQCLAVTP
jgi:prepilin-type N-terminal cleavage/methylation domain-containing protein